MEIAKNFSWQQQLSMYIDCKRRKLGLKDLVVGLRCRAIVSRRFVKVITQIYQYKVLQYLKWQAKVNP